MGLSGRVAPPGSKQDPGHGDASPPAWDRGIQAGPGHRGPSGTCAPLPRFLLFYALVYGAYGVEGPFLPALLVERGASPEALGLILAAGTAVRLLSAPLAASLADRLGAPRAVLAAAVLAAALLGCGFALATGVLGLLVVGVLVSAALAPINPLADALASRAAAAGGDGPGAGGQGRGAGFDYGLVRGMGSAAFVGGALLAGPLVAATGLTAVVWAHAGLLALGAVAVAALPRGTGGGRAGAARSPHREAADGRRGALRGLLAMPLFRRLLLVTGLVQGSHAVYGAFATLRWQEAGIGPEAIALLWSVAVASEVVVFLLLGPRLLARLGPAGLAGLAAGAGVLRWAAMACTADLAVQFLLQPLHGLTFAALHLATMRLLADSVPPRLAATAFGVQASLGPGLAGALLTLAAGPLYAGFGAGAFWAMAALCAVALPAAARLVAEEGGAGTPARGQPEALSPAATTP